MNTPARVLDTPAAAGAVDVLVENWLGAHTVPATGLYPHQWSWDSAFIALGLRHLSPRRAGQELDDLFAAQWDDGRLPQIVFDPRRDADYSPGAAFWQSDRCAGAPRVPTAGFVQPPNHAWATLAVHEADPAESERRSFLARAYPRLVAWHEYLTDRRDPTGSGLAAIVHPWESGADNSPLWDDALAAVPDTPTTTITRPDLAHAGENERPGERDYRRYFVIAEAYRDAGCTDSTDLPFLVEDPCLNALLARSEVALARIAEILGHDPRPHHERARRIVEALDALWDDDLGVYVSRDVLTGKRAGIATISGLVPLVVPGLPHAEELARTVLGPRFLGSGALLPPSADVTNPGFVPSMYWRGPAWFNMSWMIADGLDHTGREDAARALRERSIDLAHSGDYPEYVDPHTGAPHGTRSFSWTAALALDALVRLRDHRTQMTGDTR